MGKTVKEAVECAGIAEKTYYHWRTKYGWMIVDEHQKMKELESENERLKALIQLWVTTMGR